MSSAVIEVKKNEIRFRPELLPGSNKSKKQFDFPEDRNKNLRKVLLEHQKESVKAILKTLETNSRTKLILPCGVGKTIIGQAVAEEMGARTVLVLLPSLSLLSQTLKAWKNQSLHGFSALCVCSDDSVNERDDDALKLDTSDIDAPVTTQFERVRGFLELKASQPKVIFCTYQSASIVGDAAKNLTPIDLAIFDEAHKTAGPLGKHFSFSIDDKNIPVKKRLFMTATPKHLDVLKKDKDGDQAIAYSMDCEDLYGPVAYKLSFSEAVKRNLILPFKVIISVIVSSELNKRLIQIGRTKVDQDLRWTAQVASQLAIVDAMKRYNLKKAFSFHASVKEASEFTKQIQEHDPKLAVFHINGAMPSNERNEVLSQFKESEIGLVSNARCLTEGVDIPAVDLVVFTSPKKSKVDIVQAVGRAMRRAPGKECGYVLLPVYLEQKQGESIDDAVRRSNLSHVWETLQCLQEQDEELAETFRLMRQKKGKRESYSDNDFRRKVQIIGPEIFLGDLKKSITAQSVEKLVSSWEEMFGLLLVFKDKFGHANVPYNYPENPSLSFWCNHQRSKKRSGTLNQVRITRLNDIGFVWNSRTANMDMKFQLLEEFKSHNGHTNVPRDFPDAKLSVWVNNLRTKYNSGTLNEEYITRLNKLGFNWGPRSKIEDETIKMLELAIEKYGPKNLYKGYNDLLLKNRCINIRSKYKRGKLNSSFINRLQSLGFIFDPVDASCKNNIILLKQYINENGTCKVSIHDENNRKLFSWMSKIRDRYNAGKLNRKFINELDKLGFVWNPKKNTTDDRIEEVKKFKDEHGHASIPAIYEKNRKLGRWASVQRRKKRRKIINKYVETRLNDLGF